MRYANSGAKRAVLRALAQATEPLAMAAISQLTGYSHSVVSSTLLNLHETKYAGFVRSGEPSHGLNVVKGYATGYRYHIKKEFKPGVLKVVNYGFHVPKDIHRIWKEPKCKTL